MIVLPTTISGIYLPLSAPGSVLPTPSDLCTAWLGPHIEVVLLQLLLEVMLLQLLS